MRVLISCALFLASAPWATAQTIPDELLPPPNTGLTVTPSLDGSVVTLDVDFGPWTVAPAVGPYLLVRPAATEIGWSVVAGVAWNGPWVVGQTAIGQVSFEVPPGLEGVPFDFYAFGLAPNLTDGNGGGDPGITMVPGGGS